MNTTINTDNEASAMANIFSKAAEAIVAATRLPREIEALRAQVQRLEDELSQTRHEAAELAQSLANTREELTTARHTIEDLKASNVTMAATIERGERTVKHLTETLEGQREVNRALVTKLEDAELNGMVLKDDLDTANRTLDELRANFGRILGVAPKPAPDARYTEEELKAAAAKATAPPYSLREERETAFGQPHLVGGGVAVVSLEDPATMHNAIAKAVGE